MKVNFDLVRIGNIRKNFNSETILKQNVRLLKSSIRYILENEKASNKRNEVTLIIVIPGKGHDVKIYLKDIREKYIREILKREFPNEIFKRDYSIILNNMDNRIFK